MLLVSLIRCLDCLIWYLKLFWMFLYVRKYTTFLVCCYMVCKLRLTCCIIHYTNNNSLSFLVTKLTTICSTQSYQWLPHFQPFHCCLLCINILESLLWVIFIQVLEFFFWISDNTCFISTVDVNIMSYMLYLWIETFIV